MEPELIADYRNDTGEGPLWHPMEKRLYWVDIPNGRLYWFDPTTGKHDLFYEVDWIGGFTIQEDGGLLLFMEKGGVAVLSEGNLRYIIEDITGEEENRFNDVIADPAGRVFCGTMPMDVKRALAGERLGRLYRLDLDGSITQILDGLYTPNGMAFTPDRKRMFFTDSVERKIYLFDYDAETGAISNRRVFVETPDGQGVPDGMTIDADGYIWSARAGDSALYRYSQEGVEDRVIRFPTRIVSSLTFGGDDLDEIYVTTIGGDNKEEQGPGAGALFRLKLGVRGVPEFLSRIWL